MKKKQVFPNHQFASWHTTSLPLLETPSPRIPPDQRTWKRQRCEASRRRMPSKSPSSCGQAMLWEGRLLCLEDHPRTWESWSITIMVVFCFPSGVIPLQMAFSWLINGGDVITIPTKWGPDPPSRHAKTLQASVLGPQKHTGQTPYTSGGMTGMKKEIQIEIRFCSALLWIAKIWWFEVDGSEIPRPTTVWMYNIPRKQRHIFAISTGEFAGFLVAINIVWLQYMYGSMGLPSCMGTGWVGDSVMHFVRKKKYITSPIGSTKKG